MSHQTNPQVTEEKNQDPITPVMNRWHVVRLWFWLNLVDMACATVVFAIVYRAFFYYSENPRSLWEYLFVFVFVGLCKLTVLPQYWFALWFLMKHRVDTKAPDARAFLKLLLKSFFIPYGLIFGAFLIVGVVLEGFLAILDVLDVHYEVWFTREGQGFLLAGFLGSLVASMFMPVVARRFWNR